MHPNFFLVFFRNFTGQSEKVSPTAWAEGKGGAMGCCEEQGKQRENWQRNQFVHILTPTGKISQDSYGSMTNESGGKMGSGKCKAWWLVGGVGCEG